MGSEGMVGWLIVAAVAAAVTAVGFSLATAAFVWWYSSRQRKRDRKRDRVVMLMQRALADALETVAATSPDPRVTARAVSSAKKIRSLGASLARVDEDAPPAGIVETIDRPEPEHEWAMQVVAEGYKDENGDDVPDGPASEPGTKGRAKALYEECVRKGWAKEAA